MIFIVWIFTFYLEHKLKIWKRRISNGQDEEEGENYHFFVFDRTSNEKNKERQRDLLEYIGFSSFGRILIFHTFLSPNLVLVWYRSGIGLV